MSMTPAQAKRLGDLIARARMNKGLSLRDIQEQLDIPRSWLGYLEQGRSLSVMPYRLARIADLLEIEPTRIDRIAKGALAAGLPTMHTYFRAKYQLTPDQADKVVRYVKSLRTRR